MTHEYENIRPLYVCPLYVCPLYVCTDGQDEGNEDIPTLLEGLQDGLATALGRGDVVRPTFTYKPEDTSQMPRR